MFINLNVNNWLIDAGASKGTCINKTDTSYFLLQKFAILAGV